MPLVENVPEPKNRQWSKTKCPMCGRECWETVQFKWAKQVGIIDQAACTECALATKEREEIIHDGSFSNCAVCTDVTCEDGWCSWDD